MKKLIYILIVLSAVVVCVRVVSLSSYELQDGYRLQGLPGSQGKIYHGYFTLATPEVVIGLQGSRKDYIFGSVRKNDQPTFFVLHTDSGKIEWLGAPGFYKKLAEYGGPAPDMNKEVNLVDLSSGSRFFSRD